MVSQRQVVLYNVLTEGVSVSVTILQINLDKVAIQPIENAKNI